MRDDVLDTKLSVGQAIEIVSPKIPSLNHPYFRALEPQDQKIYAMRSAGMTLKEIADVLTHGGQKGARIDSVHRKYREIQRIFSYLIRFREELIKDAPGLSQYICSVVCCNATRGIRGVEILASLLKVPREEKA